MKKYTISLSLLASLLILLLASCQKKQEINLNLKPVSILTVPLNGSLIDLDAALGNEFKFVWQTTQAEDGSLVLYEVLFDKKGGDFSKPFYTTLSDDRGLQNTLTLTRAQLDAIAAINGTVPLANADLIWTVRASKGWNAVNAAESKSITIKRMLPMPVELYVTGTGTEAGNTKIKMKKISDGLFEVFVKVKSGDMTFVSQDNSQYGLQLNGTKWNIVAGAVSTGLSGTQEKVLWVKIDFGSKTGWVAEVKKMEFFYMWDNVRWFELPYVSNGTWKKSAWTVNMTSVPWGREERYKYVMVINDGTGDRDYWVNSFHGDPPGQDGAYPSSLDYRSIDLPRNDAGQWNYGWKMDRNYLPNGTVADFWVQMNATEKYNQNYQKQ